jgi:hypothetical protein
MQKTAILFLAALALSACGGRYGHDEQAYQSCVRLARQEGDVIKYLATTLRYQRKHFPSPEVEAEWKRVNAERREIHQQRRDQGCI